MRFCKPELDSVDSLNVDPCHPEQEILYSSESALADEDERMSPKAVKGEGRGGGGISAGPTMIRGSKVGVEGPGSPSDSLRCLPASPLVGVAGEGGSVS
jgi:hypothetical protein